MSRKAAEHRLAHVSPVDGDPGGILGDRHEVPPRGDAGILASPAPAAPGPGPLPSGPLDAAPAPGGGVAAAVLAQVLGRRPPRWLLLVAGLAVGLAAAVAMAAAVDTAALEQAWEAATADPSGVALAAAALLGAFSLRAVAWHQLLPGLGLGQALAGIHVALGGNHVLPFRLGEPMRVASAVRRAGVAPAPAAASTVVLRLADVLTLVAVGAVAAPAAFSHLLGPWGWLGTAVVAAAAAGTVVWVRRLAARDDTVRLPGPAALALTAGAWLLEGVAVWQALHWAGIGVDARGALLVTAVAVTAQVAAVAPSGLGTYEAAAVAALVSLGHDPGVALAAALTTHAVKTAYSLVAGGIAVVLPRPGLLQRSAPAPAGVEVATAAAPAPAAR